MDESFTLMTTVSTFKSTSVHEEEKTDFKVEYQLQSIPTCETAADFAPPDTRNAASLSNSIAVTVVSNYDNDAVDMDEN